MYTAQNPTHCPKCSSRNIYLGNKIYKKDAEGEETDIVIQGVWFCDTCGDVVGRKMNRYENDLNPDSL